MTDRAHELHDDFLSFFKGGSGKRSTGGRKSLRSRISSRLKGLAKRVTGGRKAKGSKGAKPKKSTGANPRGGTKKGTGGRKK